MYEPRPCSIQSTHFSSIFVTTYLTVAHLYFSIMKIIQNKYLVGIQVLFNNQDIIIIAPKEIYQHEKVKTNLS